MNPSRHPGLPSAADAPPSMDRASALMRDIRAEYDSAVSENKAFASFRREFQAKFEEQLHELQAVERSLADLEATHNKLRNDAENEIAMLKSQLALQQTQQPVPSTQQQHQQSTPAQDDQSVKDQPPADNPPSNPVVSNPATNVARAANPGIAASSATAPSSSLPGAAGPPNGSAPLPPASSNPASMGLAGPHRSPHASQVASMHSMPATDASARPLPSRLPAPLTSMPARTHPGGPDANPHPSAAYHSGLPSAFAVSRPMYQPPQHPGLASQPHALPPHHTQQYHPQPHSDPPAIAHHSKFPRLVGPPHPHHMQPSAHGSAPAPLPSPGSLAGAPSTIPSMMSNGAPNGPRSGVGAPHDVQPMGIMGNGPQQQQDDRMMAAKGRARVPPPRGAPHNSMLTSSRGPPSSVTPQGRPRHAGMPPMDEQSRGVSSNNDWDVVNGRGADGSVVNMNLQLQNSLEHDSVVCCVRYSWDGRYLATGSNRTAHIFDAQTGQRVAKLVDPRPDEDETNPPADSYVRAVCFSPNGEWLVTGAEDHVVKIWDVRNRVVKHRLPGHGTDIYSVDASANGRFIISGSGDKKAKLWNLDTGDLLSTLGGEFGPSDGITSVSVSPTSQHVAAGSLDKVVRVWDVETSRLVRQFEGHKDSVYSVAFSPDGRMLLSGSLDKTLKLWDLAASQQSNQCRLTFTGHNDFVLSVAFSPSGQWLISGSKDRTVQFWDPRQSSMCQLLRGHKNSVISIAHNPATKFLATGSGDCRARTWMYDY